MGTMKDLRTEPLAGSALDLPSALDPNIVPKALTKSPLLCTGCRFAWGLNWGSSCVPGWVPPSQLQPLAPHFCSYSLRPPIPSPAPTSSEDHQH
jgi:hypothetical protein